MEDPRIVELKEENEKLREDLWNLIHLFRQVSWCCDEYRQYVPRTPKREKKDVQ